jgi:hypothetical protein
MIRVKDIKKVQLGSDPFCTVFAKMIQLGSDPNCIIFNQSFQILYREPMPLES